MVLEVPLEVALEVLEVLLELLFLLQGLYSSFEGVDKKIFGDFLVAPIGG